MPEKFQTSFIPDRPKVSNQPITRPKKKSNIWTIITLVIFVVTVVATVWAYISRQFVKSDIENMRADLSRLRDDFDSDKVEAISRLDSRINIGSQLLKEHVSPTVFLNFLELHMLPSVRFQSLTLTQSRTEKIINMQATGQSTNFDSLVLQSDLFSLQPNIRDLFFSSVQNNPEIGVVDFTVESLIDPELVLFSKSIVSVNRPPERDVTNFGDDQVDINVSDPEEATEELEGEPVEEPTEEPAEGEATEPAAEEGENLETNDVAQ